MVRTGVPDDIEDAGTGTLNLVFLAGHDIPFSENRLGATAYHLLFCDSDEEEAFRLRT